MTNRDGGPAFPDMTIDWLDSGARHVTRHSGMTLRDWFAGQALAGLLSNPELDERASAEDFADDAVKCADALIAALNKEGGE